MARFMNFTIRLKNLRMNKKVVIPIKMKVSVMHIFQLLDHMWMKTVFCQKAIVSMI